jgi:hypothetical protein
MAPKSPSTLMSEAFATFLLHGIWCACSVIFYLFFFFFFLKTKFITGQNEREETTQDAIVTKSAAFASQPNSQAILGKLSQHVCNNSACFTTHEFHFGIQKVAIGQLLHLLGPDTRHLPRHQEVSYSATMGEHDQGDLFSPSGSCERRLLKCNPAACLGIQASYAASMRQLVSVISSFLTRISAQLQISGFPGTNQFFGLQVLRVGGCLIVCMYKSALIPEFFPHQTGHDDSCGSLSPPPRLSVTCVPSLDSFHFFPPDIQQATSTL